MHTHTSWKEKRSKWTNIYKRWRWPKERRSGTKLEEGCRNINRTEHTHKQAELGAQLSGTTVEGDTAAVAFACTELVRLCCCCCFCPTTNKKYKFIYIAAHTHHRRNCRNCRPLAGGQISAAAAAQTLTISGTAKDTLSIHSHIQTHTHLLWRWGSPENAAVTIISPVISPYLSAFFIFS